MIKIHVPFYFLISLLLFAPLQGVSPTKFTEISDSKALKIMETIATQVLALRKGRFGNVIAIENQMSKLLLYTSKNVEKRTATHCSIYSDLGKLKIPKQFPDLIKLQNAARYNHLVLFNRFESADLKMRRNE